MPFPTILGPVNLPPALGFWFYLQQAEGARKVLPYAALPFFFFFYGDEHGCSFLVFLTFKALSQTSELPTPTIVN